MVAGEPGRPGGENQVLTFEEEARRLCEQLLLTAPGDPGVEPDLLGRYVSVFTKGERAQGEFVASEGKLGSYEEWRRAMLSSLAKAVKAVALRDSPRLAKQAEQVVQLYLAERV